MFLEVGCQWRWGRHTAGIYGYLYEGEWKYTKCHNSKLSTPTQLCVHTNSYLIIYDIIMLFVVDYWIILCTLV